MDYKNKYLKYKNKFFNLHKQIEEFNIINKNKYLKGGADIQVPHVTDEFYDNETYNILNRLFDAALLKTYNIDITPEKWHKDSWTIHLNDISRLNKKLYNEYASMV